VQHPDDFPEAAVPKYHLVECRDGEMPMVSIHDTPEKLAHRLNYLDGEDMVVWAFLGLPVLLTKGPFRSLLLPHNAAMSVTLQPGVYVSLEDRERIIQTDGYLGPPELVEQDPEVDRDLKDPASLGENYDVEADDYEDDTTEDTQFDDADDDEGDDDDELGEPV
jgi:hypothetical protein